VSALSRRLRSGALALALVATSAFAGGPLVICDGAPVKYPGSVTLNYDLGALGSRTKGQADAIVASSVALWTNVPTSNVVIGRGPTSRWT